jgi:hypothetical protein
VSEGLGAGLSEALGEGLSEALGAGLSDGAVDGDSEAIPLGAALGVGLGVGGTGGNHAPLAWVGGKYRRIHARHAASRRTLL